MTCKNKEISRGHRCSYRASIPGTRTTTFTIFCLFEVERKMLNYVSYMYNNRQKMGLNREMHEPMTRIMQLRLLYVYVACVYSLVPDINVARKC